MENEYIRGIIKAQREFYNTGVSRDVDFRVKSLKRLRSAIMAYEDRLYEALWDDLHKSAFEGYLTEVSLVLQEIRYHIRHLKRWAAPRRVSSPFYLPGSRSRIVSEPLGVVLIVAPWNYPFQLLINPLVGALSAGNCVVLKPSPYTSRVARVMAEMIASVFAPEYVAVVQGGYEVNRSLWAERFDHIFFTGSPELGKVVMKAAAEHLTPVTLELGGKSPCIVDKDADIGCAAKRIAWGKCLNAGQTCIAPDYLLVHTRVKNELLEKLIYYIRQFYGEQPEKSPDYPRIVRQEAVTRLERLMPKEKIVYGGKVIPEERFIAPTILDRISPQDAVMKEEIFGPLLPVVEFYDLEEAIGYINAREKPLALYYFGTTASAKKVIAKTSSGGVCINDTVMHIANGHLPFGGVGHSGMGRYHGFDSFAAFSNRRSVLISPTLWDMPLKYPPYRGFKLLKRFIK